MLLGLLTAGLGNEGAWTPEHQEQLDTRISPFETTIQAFHQSGELEQGWKTQPQQSSPMWLLLQEPFMYHWKR